MRLRILSPLPDCARCPCDQGERTMASSLEEPCAPRGRPDSSSPRRSSAGSALARLQASPECPSITWSKAGRFSPGLERLAGARVLRAVARGCAGLDGAWNEASSPK
eukprot:CAMPEP_0185555392 /NCGR_PEP_ID=MMETSP1381-20130426/44311_1 /TAXON_ID=298111 /ORGANISM="Pavlova sp., Strain CCMP459" /LENGTH=106 /DNA_ID=CAMNT_0028168691 /DNA_START=128 /DNA_END=448 /DNA_ORIENTATION=+